MILDRLDNWKLYFQEGTLIARGFDFLQRDLDLSLPDGRIDIDGDRIYAVLATYETRTPEQCRFEVHRRYLDIQYLVEGSEVIGWSALDQLKVSESYDVEKDVEFLDWPTRCTSLEVYRGQFAVFFPDDGHAPGLRCGDVKSVRKVVVKILAS